MGLDIGSGAHDEDSKTAKLYVQTQQDQGASAIWD
jgi:hypothetical protein